MGWVLERHVSGEETPIPTPPKPREAQPSSEVGTADSVLGEGPAALGSLTGLKKNLNVSL